MVCPASTARREFETPTADDTRAVAAALGRRLERGALILLEGDLGAGKTTFAQGLASGLGVTTRVVSPSFTLAREYESAPGRPRFVHADLYRIATAREVVDLAFDEILDDDCILAVEWPERAGPIAADDRIEVRIEDLGASRRIVLVCHGRACSALRGLVVPEGVAEQ